MINRDSVPYRAGRLVGRVTLIVIAYIFGRRAGRRPINKFPKKKSKQ